MTDDGETSRVNQELAALIGELEQAEAYEQRLRQIILDARDQLAAGRTSMALSILNEALSGIDAAADVVAPTDSRREVRSPRR